MISLLQKSWHTTQKKLYVNKFIKNQHNRFPFERVEDVCPLSGAGSDWGWFPQWWSLPHSEKWQKLFLWWGLPNRSLLCILMLLLWLNFLPQPLQASTLQMCCQILCWLSICKDLKALSQTLQGLTLPLSCAPCAPIQQQHNFPHKPALNTCRWAVSTPIPYLLFPSISYLSSSFFSSSYSSFCFSSLRRLGQALASFSPRFQNTDRF